MKEVEAKGEERLAGAPIGFWEDSWIRLKKNRAALVSLVLIVLLFTMAFIVGPMLSRYSPLAQDLGRGYAVHELLVRHRRI